MAKKIVNRVKKKSEKTSAKKMPLGVKILVILGYIGVVATILLALFVFIVGIYFKSNPDVIDKDVVMQQLILINQNNPDFNLQQVAIVIGVLDNLLIFMGVIFGLLALISFFITRGLHKGKNWARITEIVLLSLGILNSVFGLVMLVSIKDVISKIILIIILGVIVYYLGFNKKVKSFFNA